MIDDGRKMIPSHNIKIKKYTDKDVEYIFYDKHIEMFDYEKYKMVEKQPRGKGERIKSIRVSTIRAKQNIYDYARSNDWEYMLTFTFSPHVVDRYDYDAVSKKLCNWLSNIRKRKAPNLRYIVIPELHEDGAFHFHGLLSELGDMSIIDSGHKTKSGQPIFNITDYKLGWSTAVKIYDGIGACGYFIKYITKDIVKLIMDKKKYWTSRNLNKPTVQLILETPSMKNKQQANIEEQALTMKSVDIKWTKNTVDYYNLDMSDLGEMMTEGFVPLETDNE